MGNNDVGKKVNTPKGKYLGKYLFTFGIRFLLEPYALLNSGAASAAAKFRRGAKLSVPRGGDMGSPRYTAAR